MGGGCRLAFFPFDLDTRQQQDLVQTKHKPDIEPYAHPSIQDLKIYFYAHGSQNFKFNHVPIIGVLIMDFFLQIHTLSIYFFLIMWCVLSFGHGNLIWVARIWRKSDTQTDRNCSLGSNGLYLLLWSTPIMHQCRTSAHMFPHITQREKLAKLGRCFKHAFSSCKHQRGESCSS